MKAVVCTEYGDPTALAVHDMARPTPRPDEAVLAVKAAGLNYRDLLAVQNKYQSTPALPFCPGCEASGIVTEVGERVRDVQPGDRVMAFTEWGAFAQHVSVKGAHLARIPAGMAFETAAGMLVTYGTALHALVDRARLERGQCLVVFGAAGAAGLAAIEIGKALGAFVIACASSDERTAVCRDHGADASINYSVEDIRQRVRQLAPEGAHVVYDPVGGRLTEVGVRLLGWRGRLLVVGFSSGTIAAVPMNLLLVKGCSLDGVWWGEFVRREPARFADACAQLVTWHQDRIIKASPNHSVAIDSVGAAMTALAERSVIGKIVVTIGG
jgi:NADPH2:quinone reductase